MKKGRFTPEQIIGMLKQHEAGRKVQELGSRSQPGEMNTMANGLTAVWVTGRPTSSRQSEAGHEPGGEGRFGVMYVSPSRTFIAAARISSRADDFTRYPVPPALKAAFT